MAATADRAPSTGAARWGPLAVTAASAAVILGPLLGPGYVLRYDMVFAPKMSLGADALGLGSALPRAVPSDLVVALASHVLAGDVLQKLVLVSLVLAAGLGAARVCGGTAVGRCAAALAYVWSPYFGERLLLGQWAVLVGWAVLPWAVLRAHGYALAGTGRRTRAFARLMVVVGVAALGGAPAMLIVLPTTVVVAAFGAGAGAGVAGAARLRRAAAVLAAAVVLALPWALPALLRPGGTAADPAGSLAFAPRADTPLGTALSLLGGGGVWNAAAVPALRDSVAAGLAALVLLAAGLTGLALVRRGDRVVRSLAVVAAVTTAFVLCTGWQAGRRVLDQLPESAVVRDSQRFLVPLVLLVAIGFGALVARLGTAAVPGPGRAAIALLAALPVAVLPSLAWGVSGRLRTARYPPAYGLVRALLAADPRPGGVFVLPPDPYRRFGWNPSGPVLDPLPHLVDRPTLLAVDLQVLIGHRPVAVRGEDQLAERLATAARTGTLALAAAHAGIRFVIADAPVPPSQVVGLHLLRRVSTLTVYEVRGVDAARARDPYRGYAADPAPVVVGDLIAVLLLVSAGIFAVPRRRDGLLLSPTSGSASTGQGRLR